jgi:hypothetical protein
MSLQPESPSPAPRQNVLMRRLPAPRLTISFSLPPAEAWGRLLGPSRKEWRVKQAGTSKVYRYNLHPHADGVTLDIDGPYGDRSGAIQCRIRLIAAGSGTTLVLENQHKGNPYWGLAIPLVVMIPWLLAAPLWFGMFGVVLLIFVWYGVMTIGVHIAADQIQRHVVALLNDDRPGVLL